MDDINKAIAVQQMLATYCSELQLKADMAIKFGSSKKPSEPPSFYRNISIETRNGNSERNDGVMLAFTLKLLPAGNSETVKRYYAKFREFVEHCAPQSGSTIILGPPAAGTNHIATIYLTHAESDAMSAHTQSLATNNVAPSFSNGNVKSSN